MFQRTKELDPDVKLFVNDYDIIAADQTEDYIESIKKLKAAGAKVDTIGVQGHFNSFYTPDNCICQLNFPHYFSWKIGSLIGKKEKTFSRIQLTVSLSHMISSRRAVPLCPEDMPLQKGNGAKQAG